MMNVAIWKLRKKEKHEEEKLWRRKTEKTNKRRDFGEERKLLVALYASNCFP